MTRLTRGEKALTFLFVLTLAYPAWMRGGTPILLQDPLPVLGGLVLLSLWMVPMAYRMGGDRWSALGAATLRVIKDPIFYLGVAFLALLVIQWRNSGRSLVFDLAAWKWVYSDPPNPGLPSAVRTDEAAQMLCWFFPAWTLILGMRARLLSRSGVRFLFTAMVLNAAAISLFGIVQFLSGTRSMFWLIPIDAHFFASFGYSGHAGAFFLLMFSLCCGLVVDGLFDRQRRIMRGELAVLLGATVLNFVGANLSLAVAPTALVWMLGAAVAVYVLVWTWLRLERVHRIHVLIGIVGVACLGYIIIALIFRATPERVQASLWEIGRANVVCDKIIERIFLARAAVAVWLEAPWFGTGGWGFRYFFGIVLDPGEWELIGVGDANVHNDFLQFLAEFGVVGTLLLIGTCAGLLGPIMRSGAWRRPIVLLPTTGALIVLAYSLMDLPFRCPAVLYAWATLLAAMPVFVIRSQHETR